MTYSRLHIPKKKSSPRITRLMVIALKPTKEKFKTELEPEAIILKLRYQELKYEIFLTRRVACFPGIGRRRISEKHNLRRFLHCFKSMSLRNSCPLYTIVPTFFFILFALLSTWLHIHSLLCSLFCIYKIFNYKQALYHFEGKYPHFLILAYLSRFIWESNLNQYTWDFKG